MPSLYRVIKGTAATFDEETLQLRELATLPEAATEMESDPMEVYEAKVKEASEVAEKILEEAKSKAKSLKEQAYQEGFDSGWQKGVEEGNQFLEKAHIEAQKLLSEVEDYRKETLEELREDIKNLTIQIAEKIVLGELKQDPEVISRLVTESIKEVQDRKVINIFLSPDDTARIDELKEQITALVPIATVKVISDPTIELGGCRIKTEAGWIDATLDTQLGELKRVLI